MAKVIKMLDTSNTAVNINIICAYIHIYWSVFESDEESV